MWASLGIDSNHQEISKLKIPRCYATGLCLTATNKFRCKFTKIRTLGGGSYGLLNECIRTDASGNELIVLIKKSKISEISLRNEAFIQFLVHTIFTLKGLENRVPPVYDIFEDNGVAFSMKPYKNAPLLSDKLLKSQTTESDFFHCLAQVAGLLCILQKELGLDHRDLKADNLLLLDTPSILVIESYTIHSPFTVVLVDFGFSCLGTSISAGDIFPPLDPCPKDGRDLFHFLVSLYGMSGFREKISKSTLQFIETLLKVGEREWHSAASKWSYTEWLFLLTTEKGFRNEKCLPLSVLKAIHSREPSIVQHSGSK